jgi:hypothetical protein
MFVAGYLSAYLPRTRRVSSYSRGMEPPAFVTLPFYIGFSLRPARAPGAEDSDIIRLLRVDDDHRSSPPGHSDQDETCLAFRVIGVGHRHGKRILERRHRLMKGQPVSGEIRRCLPWIPREPQTHCHRVVVEAESPSPQPSPRHRGEGEGPVTTLQRGTGVTVFNEDPPW